MFTCGHGCISLIWNQYNYRFTSYEVIIYFVIRIDVFLSLEVKSYKSLEDSFHKLKPQTFKTLITC